MCAEEVELSEDEPESNDVNKIDSFFQRMKVTLTDYNNYFA